MADGFKSAADIVALEVERVVDVEDDAKAALHDRVLRRGTKRTD
jgi:hypothetical protein